MAGQQGLDSVHPVSYTHLDVYKRQTLPCRSIELLTDEDKFCQRALLSGPVLPVDPNDTIITRFRPQAALHPDRRALSGKGPSLSLIHI